MSRDISNKVAIITGAGEGIGLAIADEFLRKGAKTVVILDINEEFGIEAANKLNAKYGGNKAEFHKCDVTTDLDSVSPKIFDKYDKIDILVNNAGTGEVNNVEEIISVNLQAVITWSYKFNEHMRKDKGGNGGTIINLGSIHSYRINPLAPIYKATKFGVRGFSTSLGHSYNYERSGVRVLCLCPGYTDTSLLTKNLDPKAIIDAETFLKDKPFQKPAAVGLAAGIIFEIAKSGTVWEIEGGKPVKEVVENIEYKSDS